MDTSTKTQKLKAYSALLTSPKWFDRRKEIVSRDGSKCSICGSSDQLEVHHKQYHIKRKTRSYKLPWEYQGKYLITLCRACHQAGHQQYKVPTFNV